MTTATEKALAALRAADREIRVAWEEYDAEVDLDPSESEARRRAVITDDIDEAIRALEFAK